MRLIPLSTAENQSFNVVLDNILYNFRIATRAGSVLVTISENDKVIVQGARAVSGQWIIWPQSRLIGRNFFFNTMNGELVNPASFGTTQFLYYYP